MQVEFLQTVQNSQLQHIQIDVGSSPQHDPKTQSANVLARVTDLDWSTDGTRFGSVSCDGVTRIYDAVGSLIDEFVARCVSKDSSSEKVGVVGFAFSPKGERVALAQADGSVLVYRFESSEKPGKIKKSISNKFSSTGYITSLCWPEARNDEIVFGDTSGRVRLGILALRSVRKNKVATLFQHASPVLALTSSNDAKMVYSAHADGTVLRYSFPDTSSGKSSSKRVLANLQFEPKHMALFNCNQMLLAGRSHRQESELESETDIIALLDLTSASLEWQTHVQCTCLAPHPAGEAFLAGSDDGFRVFSRSRKAAPFQEQKVNVASGMETCAAAWKPDGSRVLVASSRGWIDMYDAALRRVRLSSTSLLFEATFTSVSSLLLRQVSEMDGKQLMCCVASRHGGTIQKVRVQDDRFVVVRTSNSVIVGDMDSESFEAETNVAFSEVTWTELGLGDSAPEYMETESPDSSSNLKKQRAECHFFFDAPGVCQVHVPARKCVVLLQLGRAGVLTRMNTPHLSPHLVSVRLHARRMAFLLDSGTVQLRQMQHSLDTGVAVQARERTLSIPGQVDWLELNADATRLLLRCVDGRLVLVQWQDTQQQQQQQQQTVLYHGRCEYAQWVPDADVVVAECDHSLLVWYDLDAVMPEKVSLPAETHVEDIECEKQGEECHVILSDHSRLPIDADRVLFSTALRRGALARAVAVADSALRRAAANAQGVPEHEAELADYEMSPELRSMFGQAAQKCLNACYDSSNVNANTVELALRCFGALGDTAQVALLETALYHLRRGEALRTQLDLAVLRGDVPKLQALANTGGFTFSTEHIVALLAYLGHWREAYRLAELRAHPRLADVRRTCLNAMCNTQNSGSDWAGAAAILQSAGDSAQAVELLLRGNLPARAAQVILDMWQANRAQVPPELLQQTVQQLLEMDLHKDAGSLLERTGDTAQALTVFVQGDCFEAALSLARRCAPHLVVQVERQYAEYLAHRHQWKEACAHYIEAGNRHAAVDAAIHAQQTQRALQLLRSMDVSQSETRSLCVRVTEQLLDEGTPNSVQAAVQLLHQAGAAQELMSALARRLCESNNIEDSFASFDRELRRVYDEKRVNDMYTQSARSLESELHTPAQYNGSEREHVDVRYLVAELFLVAANEIDEAIAMHKRAHHFERVIALVGKHRRELLDDTHRHLARQLQREGDLRGAERHLVRGHAWKTALQMYRAAGEWQSALDLAQKHGGAQAYKQVAFAWAVHLAQQQQQDAALRLLMQRGLFDEAVDMLLGEGDFEEALSVAKRHATHKLQDVHTARGMRLEDEGHFEEASEAFVAANKAQEAVQMFLHQRRYDDAAKVARECCDKETLQQVQLAHAEYCVEQQQWSTAESLYVAANDTDAAVAMYRRAGLYGDAERVAQQHGIRTVIESNINDVTDSSGYDTGAMSTTCADANELHSKFNLLVKQEKFNAALECFLSQATALLQAERRQDVALMEEAARVATQFCAGRHIDTGSGDTESDAVTQTAEVCAALFVRAGQTHRAAVALISARKARQAVEVLLKAGMRREAQRLAARHCPDFVFERVESSEDTLTPTQRVLALADAGDFDNAYFEASQLELPTSVSEKIALLQAKQQDTRQALQTLLQRGATVDALPFYADLLRHVLLTEEEATVQWDARDLALRVLGKQLRARGLDERTELPLLFGDGAALRRLRRALGDPEADEDTVAFALSADVNEARQVARVALLGMACHLTGVFLHSWKAVQRGDADASVVAFKSAVSLLRYLPEVHVERAFYRAGQAARKAAEAGHTEAEAWAFLCCNRFVDLSDLRLDASDVEELSVDGDDDFASAADVPPAAAWLSTWHSQPPCGIPQEESDEVREWLLQHAMSTQAAETTLPSTPCRSCGQARATSSFVCPHCAAASASAMCLLTGWPLDSHNDTDVHTCHHCLRTCNAKDLPNLHLVRDLN